MAAKFVLKKTDSGKFMFNLKAGNGEVILTSEQYNSKASAKNGIESVKENSASEGNFEVRTAKNDAPYFVLKAANGQVIGQSEMYSSDSSMKNGIASVMKNAPVAEVDDKTAE